MSDFISQYQKHFKSVLQKLVSDRDPRLLQTNGRCCALEAPEINFEHYRCRGAPRREANTLLAWQIRSISPSYRPSQHFPSPPMLSIPATISQRTFARNWGNSAFNPLNGYAICNLWAYFLSVKQQKKVCFLLFWIGIWNFILFAEI